MFEYGHKFTLFYRVMEYEFIADGDLKVGVFSQKATEWESFIHIILWYYLVT